MWFCAIAFLVCFVFAVTVGPLLGLASSFGIMAVMFLCTGILIEHLEDLFKKYFDKDKADKI